MITHQLANFYIHLRQRVSAGDRSAVQYTQKAIRAPNRMRERLKGDAQALRELIHFRRQMGGLCLNESIVSAYHDQVYAS